jgi:hypothetical protein
LKYIPFFWSTLKHFFLKKKEAGSLNNERRVVFENNGQSGYVIYKDGRSSTRFYTEVGGGACIFYISIPAEQLWENQTGYSLESRKQILQSIAEEGLKKQARMPGAYYKINDTSIAFYQ